MVNDVWEELREAEEQFRIAEITRDRARKKAEATKRQLMEKLTIGKNVPCRVAILPSGSAAVHVWVDGSANSSQLHIVEPIYFDKTLNVKE